MSTILIANELALIGRVVVARNRVERTNATGIRACYDYNAYVHNNTLIGRNVGIAPERGVTLHSPTIPVRLENNTISNFLYGVWVKKPGAPNVNARGQDIGWNTITGNTEGVMVGWGDVAESWADIHDNLITNNTVGVNVSAMNEGGTIHASHAFLRRNTISSNTYGVRVQAFFDASFIPREQWAQIYDRNTITNNQWGVYLKGIVMPNSVLFPVWANISDNNTVASNQYGVWIDGPTVDPNAGKFRLWWSDVRENTNYGVWVQGDPTTRWGPNRYHNATCNWWKDISGPHDPTDPISGPPDQNTNPAGQPVSDYFYYREKPPTPAPRKSWLNNTWQGVGTVCLGAP